MELVIGQKYKLRRLKDLYCNYIMKEENDYLVNFKGEGLLNHRMDGYMGKEVVIRGRMGIFRQTIEECSHSNFHINLFEDYKE